MLRVAADGASPEHAAAATALSDLVLATLAGRARATLARRDAWPEGWRHGALSQAAYTSYLTLPEARQLRADLHAMLTRHFDRVDHPERRPAGALPVEFLAVAYPLLHLLEVPAAAAPAPEKS